MHYTVISAERVGSYDYYEPPEYWHDVVCLDADSPNAAKGAALKHPDFKGYVKECRRSGASPFTGMKVEKIEPCPHGVLRCCAECEVCNDAEEAEFYAEEAAQCVGG